MFRHLWASVFYAKLRIDMHKRLKNINGAEETYEATKIGEARRNGVRRMLIQVNPGHSCRRGNVDGSYSSHGPGC